MQQGRAVSLARYEMNLFHINLGAFSFTVRDLAFQILITPRTSQLLGVGSRVREVLRHRLSPSNVSLSVS